MVSLSAKAVFLGQLWIVQISFGTQANQCFSTYTFRNKLKFKLFRLITVNHQTVLF